MSPLSLDKLFNQFCKEREYVKNSSRHTILFYQSSYKTFRRVLGDDIQLTKNNLTRFVLGMREKGMKPETCNVYIRGLNSFLGWLFESEHISEQLKIDVINEMDLIITAFLYIL